MSSEAWPTRCPACDRTYPASPDEPHRCSCGAALELARVPPAPTTLEVGQRLWDYATALPPGERIDLGAGGTPLLKAPFLDARIKLETTNPTGSFKDRGAAVTISRAATLGVDRLKEDSSGNAGLAIATYAARAGIDATVFVPADAAGSTLESIAATGAEVVAIEGARDEVARRCIAAEAGWYASHAWRPEFYDGTATMAWELVAQSAGAAPDAIVLPVGHGTLLLGLYRGFARLVDAGKLAAIPPLYAAQLRGTGSLLAGEEAIADELAPGIRIDTPAREEQVRAAVETSGGAVVPVDPDRVAPARDRLARHGFDACTTAAVAAVARDRLSANGELPAGREVVVVLTGRARDR